MGLLPVLVTILIRHDPVLNMVLLDAMTVMCSLQKILINMAQKVKIIMIKEKQKLRICNHNNHHEMSWVDFTHAPSYKLCCRALQRRQKASRHRPAHACLSMAVW